MVDTFRRWETFLPLFELLVSFLQMSALGAASTDMHAAIAVNAAVGVIFRVISQLLLGRLGLHAVYFSH